MKFLTKSLNMLKRIFSKLARFNPSEHLPYIGRPDNAWRIKQSLAVRRLFKYCNIDYVVDVGANRGQFVSFLRSSIGYKSNVLSIEPIPELVNILRSKSKYDSHWEILPVAVDVSQSKRQFNLMKSDTFSSFLEPSDIPEFDFSDKNLVVDRINVETVSLQSVLDDILSRNPSHNIFLKLDTQGYDYQILSSSQHILKHISALMVEISFKSIYQSQEGDWLTLLQFLNNNGFELCSIDQNNSGHFPYLIESDALFLRVRD